MNQRHVVVVALLWTGALVMLSRSWLGDIRAYVESVTGGGNPSGSGGGGGGQATAI